MIKRFLLNGLMICGLTMMSLTAVNVHNVNAAIIGGFEVEDDVENDNQSGEGNVQYDESEVNVTKITSISVKTNEITINWNSVAGADYYVLYRKVNAGSYEELKQCESTSYTDKARLNNTDVYTYKIVVVKGEKKLAYSKEKSAFLDPVKPSNFFKSLSITRTKIKKAKLKWKAVPGATGYEILRATKYDGDYKLVRKLEANTTTWTDSKKLTASNQFYYKVKAVKSYNGDEKSFTSGLRVAFIQPAETEDFYGYSAKSLKNKIKLQWAKVPGATGYDLYRAGSKNGTYSKVKSLGAKATSYTDKNLKAGKTYYYKLVTKRRVKKAANKYTKVKKSRLLKNARKINAEVYCKKWESLKYQIKYAKKLYDSWGIDKYNDPEMRARVLAIYMKETCTYELSDDTSIMDRKMICSVAAGWYAYMANTWAGLDVYNVGGGRHENNLIVMNGKVYCIDVTPGTNSMHSDYYVKKNLNNYIREYKVSRYTGDSYLNGFDSFNMCYNGSFGIDSLNDTKVGKVSVNLKFDTGLPSAWKDYSLKEWLNKNGYVFPDKDYFS